MPGSAPRHTLHLAAKGLDLKRSEIEEQLIVLDRNRIVPLLQHVRDPRRLDGQVDLQTAAP